MIEAHGLTKDYGDKRAVDDLSFTVEPGVVTGFLGPNGGYCIHRKEGARGSESPSPLRTAYATAGPR